MKLRKSFFCEDAFRCSACILCRERYSDIDMFETDSR